MFLRKGFTILELLIVIAIIAILVGMALPRFKGMQDEANIAKANGELRALRTAVESYYIHQAPNAYPPTTSTLCATYLTAATTIPKIIDTDLYDPFGATTTTEYQYVLATGGKYYVIYSVGPNGNGTCTIADTGVITRTNSAPYASNGHLPIT